MIEEGSLRSGSALILVTAVHDQVTAAKTADDSKEVTSIAAVDDQVTVAL